MPARVAAFTSGDRGSDLVLSRVRARSRPAARRCARRAPVGGSSLGRLGPRMAGGAVRRRRLRRRRCVVARRRAGLGAVRRRRARLGCGRDRSVARGGSRCAAAAARLGPQSRSGGSGMRAGRLPSSRSSSSVPPESPPGPCLWLRERSCFRRSRAPACSSLASPSVGVGGGSWGRPARACTGRGRSDEDSGAKRSSARRPHSSGADDPLHVELRPRQRRFL